MNHKVDIDLENDTFEEIFKKLIFNSNAGIKYFDTQTDLINEENIKAGDCCITLGGTEINDGKQAIYKIKASLDSSESDAIELKNGLYAIYIKGFSGGNGSDISTPKITSSFPEETIGTSLESYKIKYYFSSPNIGQGTETISIDNVETSKKISQGNNYIDISNLDKGVHTIKVYVVDSKGLFTNELTFTFKIGTLEISSTFNADKDYTLSENISIVFDVSYLVKGDYYAKLVVDGTTSTISVKEGLNTWTLGRMSLGVHKVSIQAYSDTLQSNVLNYSIVVSDSTSLFICSDYGSEINFEIGELISIPYRISLQGVKKFKSYYYVDDDDPIVANTVSGINYCSLSELAVGTHKLKIIVTTLEEELTSNELNFTINVTSEDFTPFNIVEKDLIAYFDARDNSNDNVDNSIWKDRSGNNIECLLHNFNFSSNGWNGDYLQFSGDSYAEINYKPFAENIQNGFTFEILFSVENTGDIEGRVCDCKLESTPYTGFEINSYKCDFSSSKVTISTDLSENSWTRKTLVVDRVNKMYMIYVNAILTKVNFIEEDESFSLDKIITLGARKNNNGEIVNTGSCKIKTIRMYNRALTHEEVLQNHIADIHNKDEQMAIRKLNYDVNGMPSMYFYGDLTEMTKENPVTLRIRYNDPNDPTKNFDKLNCTVKWQGTSTIFYAIKNYKIKLVNDDGSKFKYSPVDTWLPESTFTLKADYMESSHANNIGIAKFLEDYYTTKLPPQEENPLVRNAIDGFPMLLYINGELAGIYDFNIDKGASNCFGFDGYDKCMSYEVSANSNLGAGSFATDVFNSIKSEFEVRYHYDEDNVVDENELLIEGKHPELQELVTWVCNADDEEFKTNFTKHFNLDYALGYFVLVYTLGMVDNLGKNMMLTTYDGNIWYPQFYDMDF